MREKIPCGGRRTRRGRAVANANFKGMKNEAVIDGITVGGQPTAEELKSGRFASVVNLRLDSEVGNDTKAILAGSDVAYTSVPWTADTVTKEDIARIREAVDAAQGPVLIHCMLAARAATAAAIVSADREGSGEAGTRKKLADAGFQLDGTPYSSFIERYYEE